LKILFSETTQWFPGAVGLSSNLIVENQYAPVKFLVQIDDRVVGIKMGKMLVFDIRGIEPWIDRVAEQALAGKKSFCSRPARERDEDSSYQLLLWETS
jgi:hypothetical protein